jgi:uncharacterized Zn finger protein
MKLRRTTILRQIETLLTEDVMPLVPDDFAQNDVRMAASLLAIDRAERENAVALLVEEHERLRALFASAVSVVEDKALRDRLETAANQRTGNFRLSALEAETGALRDLLVELHVHVEARDDEAARELDRAIWRAIRDTERARNPAN